MNNSNTFQVAFFVGTSPGLLSIVDFAIRTDTHGPYTHCELVFSDGRSASSVPGQGVRFTEPGSIDFNDTTQWELMDLTGLDEVRAIDWFTANQGHGYDFWGDASFVLGILTHSKGHDFCSEACAYALGFDQGWRFDPNTFYVVLKRLMTAVNQKVA
jgi:hypothetical protein